MIALPFTSMKTPISTLKSYCYIWTSKSYRIFPFSLLQAPRPLCNPIRRGPFFGGLFRELLCEWQCDQAGDGLDAWPVVGLLHQLAAAVAGRSSALCGQSLEVESILRYVRRCTRTQHKRKHDCLTKNTDVIISSFYSCVVFGTERFYQNSQLNQHSKSFCI